MNICTAIVVILLNLSSEPWTKHDIEECDIAKHRCPVHFVKTPCLKKFIKVEYHTYRAICGNP
jgi:hypothetical protein